MTSPPSPSFSLLLPLQFPPEDSEIRKEEIPGGKERKNEQREKKRGRSVIGLMYETTEHEKEKSVEEGQTRKEEE
jgi:hypothetical protein